MFYLSQHKWSVHPSSYHDALAPSAAVCKARWDREEMVFMAREELHEESVRCVLFVFHGVID